MKYVLSLFYYISEACLKYGLSVSHLFAHVLILLLSVGTDVLTLSAVEPAANSASLQKSSSQGFSCFTTTVAEPAATPVAEPDAAAPLPTAPPAGRLLTPQRHPPQH